jgi:hypothetical protein
MNIGLQVLRAKIIGFQSVGISIKNQISKSAGLKRDKLWQRKRALGCYNREHLIAYGLLRGVPYEKIENKCAKYNKPNVDKIYVLIKQHGGWKAQELTPEKMLALLSPPKALEKNEEK